MNEGTSIQSEITIKHLHQLAEIWGDNFLPALHKWESSCECIIPGHKLVCSNCPYFRGLVLQLRARMLEEKPGQIIPLWLAPLRSPPFTSEDEGIWVELYQQGFSLDEIKVITGISHRKSIRKWLKAANLLKQPSDYSQQQRSECLRLYRDGLKPHAIEHQTGVWLEVINSWLREEGLIMKRRAYSPDQRLKCQQLYQKGISLEEIEEQTGVLAASIRRLMSEAKIQRPQWFKKINKLGRPSTYSQEFKQKCIAMLDSGMTAAQVQVEMGPTADTIRRWHTNEKKDSAYKQPLDSSASPQSPAHCFVTQKRPSLLASSTESVQLTLLDVEEKVKD